MAVIKPTALSFLAQSHTKTTRTAIHVGGHGDCGFRSVAAGFIDNFLMHSHFSVELLNKVFSRHFVYYPQHRPQMTGLTRASDMMTRLLTDVSKPELIQTMAFTLRQLAVDEMVAHPERYRGAFVQDHEQTSPEFMRDPATWIDESSILALAYALDMPIEVRVVESGKELSLPPLNYPPGIKVSATKPKVVIELKAGHYRPELLDPSYFKSDIYDTFPEVKPIISGQVADPELPEILMRIETEEQRLIAEFEALRHNLHCMLKDGTLTKNRLLELYIKGMATSDYLQGRVRHVDDERGHSYFSNALDAAQGVDKIFHSPLHTYDEDVSVELVHAIARAISIGHMNADDVYAHIDQQQDMLPNRGM